MSDIPDGVDFRTAQMSIAWEIAKKAFDVDGDKHHNVPNTGDEVVQKAVKYFNDAFFGLAQKPSEE